MHTEHGASSPTRPNRQNHFHQLRYVVLISAGIATGTMQALRNSMTVAMVSMVNHTQIYINTHTNMTQNDLEEFKANAQYEDGEFDWNNEVQEEIISAYMITYMIFQFPAAKLIATYGLRWGICVSLALCALFNALTPVVAHWGSYWVMILRLAHGAVASGFVGSMVSLTERWMPKGEGASGYVVYQFIANIVLISSPQFVGFLASYHWNWAYYVLSLFAMAFCIYWASIVSDGPEDSRIISQKELEIILGESERDSSIQHDQSQLSSSGSIKFDIPFYNVFRLKEFYSFLFIWSMYWASAATFFVLLPAYIHRVFQVPIDQVGGLATLAQLGALLSMLWPNRVVDLLMKRFGMSLTRSRNTAVAISIMVANFSLLWLAYYHSNIIVMVNINRIAHLSLDTLSTAAIMSQFGQYGFSGLVYSMLNSLSCSSGTVFCVLVGKLLDYTGDTLECWSWIFVSGIIMNLLYLLISVLFCHSRPIELKYLNPKIAEIPRK